MTTNSSDDSLENPDIEGMDHETLRSAHRRISEKLRTPVDDPDREMKLHILQVEVWNEMKARTDAEPPECPACYDQQWSQNAGEPKVCMGCDLHLSGRHEQLIEEVDAYWKKVKSPGLLA